MRKPVTDSLLSGFYCIISKLAGVVELYRNSIFVKCLKREG
jgi:hypothetical protein